jgi:hypothetical protein
LQLQTVQKELQKASSTASQATEQQETASQSSKLDVKA